MFDTTTIVSALAVDVTAVPVTELPRLLRHAARMRAALDAFEARVLARMADTKAHALDGATDAATWLRNETGISAREAHRRTTLADGLTGLPATAGALARGALTGEHATVLAQAVRRTPALAPHEADLVALASGVSVGDLTREVRRREMRVLAGQGATAFERQRACRHVALSADPAGGWRLGGFFDDADGRVVQRAIEQVAEELWRADHPDDRGTGARDADAAQRRADAMVELCRRAVAVAPNDPRLRLPEPLVMVVVDHDTLAGRLGRAGVCELDDGTPISPATARRLACAGGLLPVVLDGASQPLDVGRTHRFATPAQRKALIVRSIGACEAPGCTRPWWMCDAHHLGSGGWDGGARTRLEELALVCTEHHHLLHEGGATLTRHPDGSFTLTHPDGTSLSEPTRRRSQPRRRPSTSPRTSAPKGPPNAAPR